VQPAEGKKFDVVVVVAPLEVISRYEAPFRAAGMNPGLVTTSSLAALNLVRMAASPWWPRSPGAC
jgi:Tfp pilus assembly PilM family ATPase